MKGNKLEIIHKGGVLSYVKVNGKRLNLVDSVNVAKKSGRGAIATIKLQISDVEYVSEDLFSAAG